MQPGDDPGPPPADVPLPGTDAAAVDEPDAGDADPGKPAKSGCADGYARRYDACVPAGEAEPVNWPAGGKCDACGRPGSPASALALLLVPFLAARRRARR